MPMSAIVTSDQSRIAAVVLVAALAVSLPPAGRAQVDPALSGQSSAALQTRCERVEPMSASLLSQGFSAQAAKNFALFTRADCLADSVR